MPVLMRTGELGDGARQQSASNPGAQLVKSNQLDLASSYLDSHDVVTGYNPTT